MANKLFVGSLPFSMTNDDLQQLFAAHGNVVSANVISDRETGRSKGFGFVEFESAEEAAAAIKALDGSDVSGRKIVVNEAKPREERPSNGGYNNNRGGSFRQR